MSKVKDIKKEIADLVEDFKKLEKALKPKKENNLYYYPIYQIMFI